jgi:hypothetical protein
MGSVEGAATSAFSEGGDTSPRLILALVEGLGGTGVSASSSLMIGACRLDVTTITWGREGGLANSPRPRPLGGAWGRDALTRPTRRAIAMREELREYCKSDLLIPATFGRRRISRQGGDAT